MWHHEAYSYTPTWFFYDLLTAWKYTVQVPNRRLPALVFVARHFPVVHASVTS